MKKLCVIFTTVLGFLVFGLIGTNSVFAANGCSQFSIDPPVGNPGQQFTARASGCSLPASSYEVRVIDATGNAIGTYQMADLLNNGTQYSATFTASNGDVLNLSTGIYGTQLIDKTTNTVIPGAGIGFKINNGSPVTYPTASNSSIINYSINGLCGINNIDTAIGCVPIGSQNDLIGFFLKWGIGIGGGIAFLLILVAGFQIMTSRGDPNRLKAGQELMTSAIAGLLLLIFSLVILRIIGVDILQIKGFSTP